MKNFEGVWFPDCETHMPANMAKRPRRVDGKLTYQYHKLEAALSHVGQFRTAIDVGGHVGLWSMHLARRFDKVEAFEPMAEHRACFRRNVPAGNVALHGCALGAAAGRVALAMTDAGSTGSTSVVRDGGGEIPMRRLDEFAFEDVDFIKLDCEGFELFALRGGEATLMRWRPAVIVEQKPGRAPRYGLPETAAVAYLESLGATLRQAVAGDYILSWEPA